MKTTFENKLSALRGLNHTLEVLALHKDAKQELDYAWRDARNALIRGIISVTDAIRTHEDTVLPTSVESPAPENVAPKPSVFLNEDAPF